MSGKGKLKSEFVFDDHVQYHHVLLQHYQQTLLAVAFLLVNRALFQQLESVGGCGGPLAIMSSPQDLEPPYQGE